MKLKKNNFDCISEICKNQIVRNIGCYGNLNYVKDLDNYDEIEIGFIELLKENEESKKKQEEDKIKYKITSETITKILDLKCDECSICYENKNCILTNCCNHPLCFECYRQVEDDRCFYCRKINPLYLTHKRIIDLQYRRNIANSILKT